VQIDYNRQQRATDGSKRDKNRISLSEYEPLVHVNLSLLADQVGEAAADTLDLGQGIHDLLLTVNVGVEDTQNVLKLLVVEDESLND
jgi:hypothetical protein